MRSKTAILTLMLLLICSVTAQAHPAKSISPVYDNDTETLTINIVHTTSRPDSHFIHHIQVDVNDETIIDDKKLGPQDTASGREYTTLLEGLDAGDTITVTCYCNRGGTRSATITVK